jgi:transposase
MARPKPALIVTEMERQALESMAHRSRTAPQLARRARIVLACANGLDNTIVARKLRLCQPTVGRLRQRFIDDRLDGLLDEPRPGTPRTITDAGLEAYATDSL